MQYLDILIGVIAEESRKEESFANGMLEYPQYTRPEVFEGVKVPEVLLSGHHENIDKWRKDEALKITNLKRPDLNKNWLWSAKNSTAQEFKEENLKWIL